MRSAWSSWTLHPEGACALAKRSACNRTIFDPAKRELRVKRAITENGEEKLTKTRTTRTFDN
jgi:hypothetical protein